MLIYFGLTDEELENLNDIDLTTVFQSLNKLGHNVMQDYCSKPNAKPRIKEVYEKSINSNVTNPLFDWMYNGYSPIKFTPQVKQLVLSTMHQDSNADVIMSILSKPSLRLIFNNSDESRISRKKNENPVIFQLIKDRLPFYEEHYKQSSNSSYWRKI